MKEMREGEKPRFGTRSVGREIEIKVPSSPAALSGFLLTVLQIHRYFSLFNVKCNNERSLMSLCINVK